MLVHGTLMLLENILMVTLIPLLCTAPDPIANPAWLKVCMTLLFAARFAQRTITTHMCVPLRRFVKLVTTIMTIIVASFMSVHTLVFVATFAATV